MGAARRLTTLEGGSFTRPPKFLYTDMYSKRKAEKEARPTCKEQCTSKTKLHSQLYTNAASGSTGKDAQTFELQYNIVAILKNAAGVSGAQDSPYQHPTCECCKDLNYTPGKSPLWTIWEENQTTEQSDGTTTQSAEKEKQQYVDTY